jgi:hypothetical protein
MAREREIIATVDPEMPRFYEKLDGLEFVKQKDGQVRVNGLLELGPEAEVRRTLVPEPDMMWGYDPEEFQRYKQDPEKWEMAQTIKRLSARLGVVEEELSRLRATAAPQAAPEAAAAENQPAATEAPVEPTVEAPAETPEPPTGVEEQPTVAEPAEPEAPAEPAPEEPDERSWWQRTRDRIMGPVYNNHARAATFTRRKSYEYDDQGRVMVEEEVNDERQRRTGLMAGATALVGAGVGLGLGYLIWHKTGHDIHNYNIDLGLGHDSVATSPGASSGGDYLGQAGQHLDTYNLEHGKSIVQVVLPAKFDLSTNAQGVASLIDLDSGSTALNGSELPRGMFQSDGQLSRAAIEQLGNKGYDIASMSKKIVTASGGLANHKVSIVF